MLCYENKPRMRICFDPEHEIPKLQSWFAENNHPSRLQVRAANDPSVFTITEKALSRSFSWLKVPILDQKPTENILELLLELLL